MPSKEDVNEILSHVIVEDFITLWWGLKIPGLGGVAPEVVWETDPQRVLDYAKTYLETSFT